MTDKLKVGQIRMWGDWLHVDSIFRVVSIGTDTVTYKYIDETSDDPDWKAHISSIQANTIKCRKLHKLLLGIDDE